MPVFIYEPDAAARMILVEGEEWWEAQVDGKFGPCSFTAFLREWERGYKPLVDGGSYTEQQLLDTGVSVDGNGAIYGDCGWNRYTVRASGEIMFITLAARSEESKALARAAGFRLFPDYFRPR